MTTEAMRRLPRLRARPAYAHLGDDLLTFTLEDAAQDFEAYCNRSDPGMEVDAIVVELACIRLNMMGSEGTSSASEGDVSRTWDALPENIRMRMDRYRRPVWPRSTS